MSDQQEPPSAFDVLEPEPLEPSGGESAGEAFDVKDDTLDVAGDCLEPE